jgi:hypothetical protein
MSAIPLIPMRWDGEAFAPLPRFARLADEHFVIGEVYHMEERLDRSPKSHRHYFAMVKEAFDNLPEGEDRWATSEHLRRWALIKAGYCDVETIVCASKAEAVRWATFAGKAVDYSLVIPRGPVVSIYRAKSQSTKAMGREDFQASKDAVLRIVADLIAVEPAALESAVLGRAA